MLEWCAETGAAAIPYGGGTSVCGGIEPRIDDRYAGAVTIDIGALDRVLEVDPVSRAARIQAGVLGPALNEQLGERGLTLRHFPQSFEFSTLGGWIATRAGGHFATVWTHIDDLVESVRAITPAGRLGEPQAARLGRRAEPGPDADRLRGDPRRDHRGLGARPRAPRAQALLRSRVRLLRGRRRGGPCAFTVGAQPRQLPAARRDGVAAHPRRRERPRAARARLRVRPPAGRRADAPGARAGPRSRRRSGRGTRKAGERERGARRGGRGVAACVPRGALPARHPGRLRGALRDVRDRDHLGPVRGLPRDRDRGGPRRASPRSAAARRRAKRRRR